MDYEAEYERERRERRRRMIQERKRRNRRRRLIYGIIRFFGPYAAGAAALITAAVVGVNLLSSRNEPKTPGAGQDTMQQEQDGGQEQQPSAGDSAAGAQSPAETQTGANEQSPAGEQTGAKAQSSKTYEARITEATKTIGDEIDSEYAILIDMETGEILTQKGWDTVINPASMTKILTVLVAAEHVENLDDTFTISLNETDYSYMNDCSNVGFAENEVVTVRDLFYGTILPSGGDAAAALAVYVAGTREAFVDMMNEKIEELGLSDTAHMTNCVGLYDENHHCTVYDMAMILEAAMDNELCRQVLTAHTYTTSATPQHPEGILISNWFLRRIEDKDTGGEVLYAKTGYVAQSGSCAASYQQASDGRGYLCVTAKAGSSWKCIYDHVALYKTYA